MKLDQETLNKAKQTIRQSAELTQTSQRLNGQSANKPKKIVELWRLMTAMFGHKWVSSYSESIDPHRVWEACLADVSIEQVHAGMRLCAQKNMDWPPSAPEFRGMCMDKIKLAPCHKPLPKGNNFLLTDQGKAERAAQKAREFKQAMIAEGLQ